jgi:hypothetical protein
MTATHGHTRGRKRTAEYKSWEAMRSRCNSPGSHNYGQYGGRGIKVVTRWDSFANFFADMGPKPTPSHSIDRLNNDGNYEPGNCRWATRSEQNKNRRPFRHKCRAGGQ